MRLSLNIKVFFSALFFAILVSTFYSTVSEAKPSTQAARTAAGGSVACTGNANGIIEKTVPGDGCEVQPDTQKITFFRLELCTQEPTGPTTSAIVDRSKCFTFFRNDSGAEVSIKKLIGTQIGKTSDYTPVPHGTYTHGLVTMGSTFKFKSSVTFDGDVADTDSNDTGSTCVTKIPAGGASTIIYGFHNSLSHADSNVDCTDGATAAEIIIGVNTMTMDNSNNCYHLKKFVTSGPLIDAYLLQSNGQLHGSVNGSDVVANNTDGCKSGVSNGVTNIQGVMPFTIPIIISPQTIGLQIKYNNTQGLKLDMASDNVFYKFDSSFFDFTLTALTGRTRGSFR
tara:strand:+ start:35 stop:1051 length:1017 start_codon:yes stop_codon:yes gene_type:complete